MFVFSKLLRGSVALCALAGAVPAAAVSFTVAEFDQAKAALTAMSGLNMIALRDFTAAHDVEGKTYVGRDLKGSSFTAGLGTSTGQVAAANGYATLTVGRDNLVGTLNLNNGAGALSQKTVNGVLTKDVFGATIVGNTGKINYNSGGAVVRVGGNAEGDLSITSSQSAATYADISIRGYVGSITATGTGSTVRVGSLQGGANKVQVGDNATVSISSGGAGLVTAGTNANIRIGGNVTDQLKIDSGNATVSGGVKQLGVTGTSAADSIVKVGGGVGGLDAGTRAKVTITGDLGDGQNANLNFNGSNAAVKIGGQFTSANVNGLNNGNTVAVSGANRSQNGTPNGWTFNTGTAYAAPAAPEKPAVPTGADNISISQLTTTLSNNLVKLSDMLGSLRSETVNKAVLSGGNYNFTIGKSAFNTANGFVSFNVGTEIFGASNINFDFANAADLPVIINVRGVGAGTYDWLGNANLGNVSGVNQKVIWNFVGATGTINFKRIIHGSVLAPNATVTNNTPIEGSVAVKDFVAGGEVHLGTFNGVTGFLTYDAFSPRVPEPATWLQMIVGFGFLGIAMRRRKAAIA